MADDPNSQRPAASPAEIMKKKDREIAALIAAESKGEQEFVKKNYGPFADHPQLFEVLHEGVGGARRGGPPISYRDLMIWNDKEGGGPDYSNPHIGKTINNAERLIAAKAIRPILFPGG